MGMLISIPGLLIISALNSTGMLYLGLFFLSIGSAMAIPCFTSLMSQLTPSSDQGRSLGVFRSLGALGRVIGPISAAIIYWRLGSGMPYIYGSFALILPIILLAILKKESESSSK